ncbi:MAG: hypothetical protein CM1200mP2_02570 [Planctomycetaceae bacterium]|nr:MAG: hypothetical protein CM1200mP2_02570 [Planctomycetaceae bacterium]
MMVTSELSIELTMLNCIPLCTRNASVHRIATTTTARGPEPSECSGTGPESPRPTGPKRPPEQFPSILFDVSEHVVNLTGSPTTWAGGWCRAARFRIPGKGHRTFACRIGPLTGSSLSTIATVRRSSQPVPPRPVRDPSSQSVVSFHHPAKHSRRLQCLDRVLGTLGLDPVDRPQFFGERPESLGRPGVQPARQTSPCPRRPRRPRRQTAEFSPYATITNSSPPNSSRLVRKAASCGSSSA